MKKLSGILLAVCFLAVKAKAQSDSTFKLIKVINGDIDDFTVDNLDNIYILNNRNQLKKYNTNGDSVAIFNDVKKFGQVSFIDVSNPLKVLAPLLASCSPPWPSPTVLTASL